MGCPARGGRQRARKMILPGGAKLIPDAHLAALAIEHGLTLCPTDDDFAQFEGLRRVNPLNN